MTRVVLDYPTLRSHVSLALNFFLPTTSSSRFKLMPALHLDHVFHIDRAAHRVRVSCDILEAYSGLLRCGLFVLGRKKALPEVKPPGARIPYRAPVGLRPRFCLGR